MLAMEQGLWLVSRCVHSCWGSPLSWSQPLISGVWIPVQCLKDFSLQTGKAAQQFPRALSLMLFQTGPVGSGITEPRVSQRAPELLGTHRSCLAFLSAFSLAGVSHGLSVHEQRCLLSFQEHSVVLPARAWPLCAQCPLLCPLFLAGT